MNFTKNVDLNRLPVGNLEFSAIREKNKIYVDKTKLIYQLASQDSPLFFSRPRRFGKSLLINTLYSLFSSGLKYFKDLDIEKLWDDKTYHVIRLDFSDMADDNAVELKRDLGDALIVEFNVKGSVSQFDELGIRNPSRILNEICNQLSNNSTVLLIDEYDAPLTHHRNNQQDLDVIIKILSNFYATVKKYTDKFRLIFITGITRVSHVSIFSAFNNLIDLSLDEDYNSLLGFDQDDLIRYFDPYIENSAAILHLKKHDVYQKLEQCYDGFQFSINTNQTLYNPWSILNFLKNPKNGFYNYWFDSAGTASIIMNYLKISENFDFLDYNNSETIVDKYIIGNKYDISNIPFNILLYQTGYFSIRKIDVGVARLVLSNKEVEESLYRLYLIANNLKPRDSLKEKMLHLSTAIDSKDLTSIINIFNNILNECISSLSKAFDDERSIRDIIYAALTYIPTLHMIKERDTAKGRSELEIFTTKTHMLIEFKRTYQKKRSAHAALDLALNQIKSNRYGTSFSSQHVLYRVAMVISTEDKMILPNFCQEVC